MAINQPPSPALAASGRNLGASSISTKSDDKWGRGDAAGTMRDNYTVLCGALAVPNVPSDVPRVRARRMRNGGAIGNECEASYQDWRTGDASATVETIAMPLLQKAAAPITLYHGAPIRPVPEVPRRWPRLIRYATREGVIHEPQRHLATRQMPPPKRAKNSRKSSESRRNPP